MTALSKFLPVDELNAFHDWADHHAQLPLEHDLMSDQFSFGFAVHCRLLAIVVAPVLSIYMGDGCNIDAPSFHSIQLKTCKSIRRSQNNFFVRRYEDPYTTSHQRTKISQWDILCYFLFAHRWWKCEAWLWSIVCPFLGQKLRPQHRLYRYLQQIGADRLKSS